MKIGIVGSGNVGGALGTLWSRGGHPVRFGVRDPQGDKARTLLRSAGADAAAGTLQDVVEFADVVVVALPWDALPDVLPGLQGWEGKVVVDATNRMRGPGGSTSAAEDLAAMIPGARVVKAFNTIGANRFGDPTFSGERATMPIAGDDPDAKAIVLRLAGDLGFEPIDVGDLGQAGALEALAVAWVRLSRAFGRSFALRVIRD